MGVFEDGFQNASIYFGLKYPKNFDFMTAERFTQQKIDEICISNICFANKAHLNAVNAC